MLCDLSKHPINDHVDKRPIGQRDFAQVHPVILEVYITDDKFIGLTFVKVVKNDNK